jgi:hypothetical protein
LIMVSALAGVTEAAAIAAAAARASTIFFMVVPHC